MPFISSSLSKPAIELEIVLELCDWSFTSSLIVISYYSAASMSPLPFPPTAPPALLLPLVELFAASLAFLPRLNRKIVKMVRAAIMKTNEASMIASSTVVITGSLSTCTICIYSWDCCEADYPSSSSDSTMTTSSSKTGVAAALNEALMVKEDCKPCSEAFATT